MILLFLLLMVSNTWADKEPELITWTLPMVTDCLYFSNDSNRLCGLSTGKLIFTGNVTESAKIFFDEVIKQYAKNKCEDK